MASSYPDLINECKYLGCYLNEKMYIEGRSKKGKQRLSEKELWETLEEIRKELFELYNEGAQELGWR
ncbi:TPA: hypothetical protein KOR49_003827 [Clostridioides difficile]|uniref:Uncharacterized protein n=1 Tax=Clostridioides difficile TaxID=1496 RepID=A0AAN5VQE0_CLODI|nr:hypothetical protein [Clostridioides difficile]EGT3640933.1 hypothetical protein [Clostridioides difficile]EGT3944126.1 hypothetical protein [Clostridioides difficile]MBG0198851.1 hypothetical protein [Clostridioides difficile]MBH7167689.1 hypothetical protein [Clostridioides difficile]MBH7846666.1 hypothetical protein [Clostridioides difficile]